jgi:RimJ/RimL family protein N-acetyltransferase
MAKAATEVLPTSIPFPERIEGSRVLIRPFTGDDAPAVRTAVEESRKRLIAARMYWAETAHRTEEDSIDFCVKSQAAFLLRELTINLGIFERKDGRFLGGTGFLNIDWNLRRFEIGYWIREGAEGQGYVSESVRCLLRLAFEQLAGVRVELRCDARNERSRKVAERLGFILEGTLRKDRIAADGSIRDTLMFSMIRPDYERAVAAFPPST